MRAISASLSHSLDSRARLSRMFSCSLAEDLGVGLVVVGGVMACCDVFDGVDGVGAGGNGLAWKLFILEKPGLEAGTGIGIGSAGTEAVDDAILLKI